MRQEIWVYDFDGTLSSKYDLTGAEMKYPRCGLPVPLSLDCMKMAHEQGIMNIVVTAREDIHPYPDGLTRAKQWLKRFGYTKYVDYINEPAPHMIAKYGWRGGKIAGRYMFEDREFAHDGGDYDWSPVYAYLKRQEVKV